MKAMLKCIVCGKEVENLEWGVENQPLEALCFTTNGHYGSTVVDIFDGFFLEINVCDPCLFSATKAGQVAVGDSSNPRSPLRIWKGPGNGYL